MKIYLIRKYRNIIKAFYEEEDAVNYMNTDVYCINHPDIELIEIEIE